MDDRIASAADPRDFGKPLRKSRFGLWRYRVRDYRVLCEIQEARLVVLVVTVDEDRESRARKVLGLAPKGSVDRISSP